MPTLRELEKKILDGLESHQKVIPKLKRIKSKISEGKQTLEELKKEIKNFKQICGAAKFVGTECSVVSGVATVVGVGGAILTGGTSLLLVPVCSAVGTIFGIGGAAIKMTTDVVDRVKTNGFIEKSREIMFSLNDLIEELQTLQAVAQQTADYVQENFKLEKDKASSLVHTFFSMSSKLKKGVEQTGSIGVLIMFLAMANPCSADPAAGIAVAQQLYSYYQTMIGPIFFQEVARRMATQQQQVTFTLNLLTNAGLLVPSAAVASQSAAPVVGKIAASTAQTEVQTGTALIVKGGAVAGEIAVHSAVAALNVGIAVWDIVSLVKLWNSVHPAIEVLDNVLSKLIQIENSVQSQLDVAVATRTETLVDTRADTMVETKVQESTREMSDSDSDSDSESSSDEEEDDKVRVYDKTTDTMKNLLRSLGLSDISQVEDHCNRSVSELVSLIQTIVETQLDTTFNPLRFMASLLDMQHDLRELIQWNSTLTVYSYFLMIDCIHVLITLHGAVFTKGIDSSTILLKIPSVSTPITFDRPKRDYLRDLLLPIYAIMKIPLSKNRFDGLCCIYRFHCIQCEQSKEFNYVGQSRNFQARYESHTGEMLNAWMDYEDKLDSYNTENSGDILNYVGTTPSSLLYEHPFQSHYFSTNNNFHDIYEVDIVYNLPEYADKSRRHSQIRRSWEIYYQWLFKARTSQGGGSRR